MNGMPDQNPSTPEGAPPAPEEALPVPVESLSPPDGGPPTADSDSSTAADGSPPASGDGGLPPPAGSDRRTFLKGAALTAGAAGVAAWGVSPWIGDLFHRRGSYVYPGRPPTWPAVATAYSVCKMCGSDCGLVAHTYRGILTKLDGNPYHPASTEPHAPFATDPAVAKVWPAPHSLCPRGQAGRQSTYHPYRVTVPLKRAGRRGSGRWQAISWSQLISEVCDGGRLFANVPGEEDRQVPGLRALWDGGAGTRRPIDPANPDFGPQTNGLAMYYSFAEAGQADFLAGFASAFGTINLEAADACCDLNRMHATMQSLDGMTDPLKPDLLNAEYVLFFGVNVAEASFPMQALGRKVAFATAIGNLTYDLVDVRAGNGQLHARRYVPVKPGGDGAVAMGMIRWIIENRACDESYLILPGQAAAAAAGEPTFSNASWLVITEPGYPRAGQFLTTADLRPGGAAAGPTGMGPPGMGSSGGSGTAPIVLDAHTGMPRSSATSKAGSLWPNGFLGLEPVKVGGVSCHTAYQLLWQEASRQTLDEYAVAAGVARRAIEELAAEFTSHGKRAVADLGRGATMHTNGFYAGRAVMTLNFLLGNVDWAGGYIAGAGGADYTGANPGAPYPLGSWPGQPMGLPSGVPVSRSGASYEASAAYQRAMAEGRSPYPAPRPWFPLGGGQWPEMFAGINQGYPYPIKVLFQHFANPAWSMPAIAGAHDAGLPWQELVSDTAKVPLFIATDVFIAESSAYADYIVPDTTYLEGWEFPGCWPVVPTRTQGIRRPVIEPLTAATPAGAPMCMEQFLIDVAKALGLPGFGMGALPGGGDLHVREDLYLKMVANIAFDPQFLTWQGRTPAPGGPVPDGSPADLAAVSGLHRAHAGALREAEWRKAAYVLARGGRFEDYLSAYEPNLDVLAHTASAATAQLAGTGMQDWARAPHQRAPEDLAASYGRSLAQIRAAVGHRSFPAWMVSRYGSGGAPCQIYNPTVATARNALTGEAFAGTARYEPPHDYAGRLLTELDDPAEFPLVLVTHKSAVTSRGLGTVCPWLAEMSPEGFVDMNPRDAARRGLTAGDAVRVRSSTYPKGVIGRLRLLPGVRPGVVAFPHGYGHWCYASGTWEIDGKTITGDASHNVPVRLNAVMRLDPSLAGPGGWTIGLVDPVAGGQAYFETRVAVDKV
jgi:tetrathionate reductase subunit A